MKTPKYTRIGGELYMSAKDQQIDKVLEEFIKLLLECQPTADTQKLEYYITTILNALLLDEQDLNNIIVNKQFDLLSETNYVKILREEILNLQQSKLEQILNDPTHKNTN